MKYEVIVGNIGTVYNGKSEIDARDAFRAYVAKSLSGVGKAGDEAVVILKDGEEFLTHYPPEIIENPSSGAKQRARGVRSYKPARNLHAVAMSGARTTRSLADVSGKQAAKQLHSYFLGEAKKHRSIAANPSRRGEIDETAARELALYAMYEHEARAKAFAKNYGLKMRKGVFDREKAIDGLEGMIGDVYRQYCKEYGKFPCSAATKRHAAEILLEEYVLGHAESPLTANPSHHVKRVVRGAKKVVRAATPHVKKASKTVKSGLLALHSKLKKNPAATLAETLAERLISSYDSKSALTSLKIPKKIINEIEHLNKTCPSSEEGVFELSAFLRQNYTQTQIKNILDGWRRKVIGRNPLREGPDKAGGMAAFEHDVVSNPYDASEDLAELLVEEYDDNGHYLINYFGVPEDIVRKLEYLAKNSSDREEAVSELSSFVSKNYTEKQAAAIANKYREIIKEHLEAKRAARAANEAKPRQLEEYEGDYLDLFENPRAKLTASQVAARKPPKRKPTKKELEERKKATRLISEAKKAGMTPSAYYFQKQARAEARKAAAEAKKVK